MTDPARPAPARKPAAKAAPKPPPPAWRVALTEFWGGLTEPSAGAFPALVLGASLMLCVMAWFFSPATLAGPWGVFLPRAGGDAEGFVTREALILARTPATAPRVVILGSSAIAQAFGDGRALRAALSRDTGQDWDIRLLGTPGQSPLDQVALAEHAVAAHRPEGPPMVIVMGLGLHRLSYDAARLAEFESLARLGLRSGWADAEVAALGLSPRPRHGAYVLDNPRFVLVNGTEAMLRLATGQAPRRDIDHYDRTALIPGQAAPEKAREENGGLQGGFAGLVERIEKGKTAAAGVYDLYARLADRLRTIKGVQVVFIDERLAPRFLAGAAIAEVATQREVEFAAFAARVGAEYWPVMGEAGLTDADYHDNLHVKRGPAQQRIQAAMAAHLVAFARARGIAP